MFCNLPCYDDVSGRTFCTFCKISNPPIPPFPTIYQHCKKHCNTFEYWNFIVYLLWMIKDVPWRRSGLLWPGQNARAGLSPANICLWHWPHSESQNGRRLGSMGKNVCFTCFYFPNISFNTIWLLPSFVCHVFKFREIHFYNALHMAYSRPPSATIRPFNGSLFVLYESQLQAKEGCNKCHNNVQRARNTEMNWLVFLFLYCCTIRTTFLSFCCGIIQR